MAKTINKVELLGRVGADPEMRYTNRAASPLPRCAWPRTGCRKNGEDATDWHTVVVWDKLGEAVAEYVEKGQRLYVAGRLVQKSWEGDDGQRRYRTEVHAQDVVFLDSSRNGNGGNYGNGDYANAGVEDDDCPSSRTGPHSDARHSADATRGRSLPDRERPRFLFQFSPQGSEPCPARSRPRPPTPRPSPWRARRCWRPCAPT